MSRDSSFRNLSPVPPKEINRPTEVFKDDSYIVHPLERHVSNLQGVVSICRYRLV